MKVLAWPLPVLAIALLAGCSTQQSTPITSTVTVTAPPTATAGAPASTPPETVAQLPSQTPAPPAELSACSDTDLTVTNGPMESANTQRHVVVSFRNTSSHACTMVGYPGADLVTPAGGLLIHIARLPTNAAHRLTLQPGQIANADVQTSAIDTGTGNSCARWGQLVVTPPNGFTSHTLPIDVPICNATISSVD